VISPEERFAALFNRTHRPLLAYAVRRVTDPADAADIVAETFLVAWRRLDEVPPDEQARPWLFGVARRVLANYYRGEHRRVALGERLRTSLAEVVPAPEAGQSRSGRDKRPGRRGPLAAGCDRGPHCVLRKGRHEGRRQHPDHHPRPEGRNPIDRWSGILLPPHPRAGREQSRLGVKGSSLRHSQYVCVGVAWVGIRRCGLSQAFDTRPTGMPSSFLSQPSGTN